GKDEQFRRDVLALKSCEKLEVLRIGHAEIELAADHQRGSLVLAEAGGKLRRRPSVVLQRVVPGRAAFIPSLEPELFRGDVHAGGIIRAGMADEALEAAGVSG